MRIGPGLFRKTVQMPTLERRKQQQRIRELAYIVTVIFDRGHKTQKLDIIKYWPGNTYSAKTEVDGIDCSHSCVSA